MAGLFAYERAHLPGVVALCRAESWPGFPADLERAHRALTGPGVTAVVAVQEGAIVGFAYLQSDGEVQAHLSLIVVRADHRRRGIGRSLVERALAAAGGERVDLVTDSAEPFYAALPHRRLAGFRLYPRAVEGGSGHQGGPPAEVAVRPASHEDRDWVTRVLSLRWGSTAIVSRGRRHLADQLPAVVAAMGGERCGLATYHLDKADAELVTLDALERGRGVGTALLRAAARQAETQGCRRLWLVTTNDNLEAIRFYQRRGLRVVAVHAGAADDARRIKPQIPEVGRLGIAVHDEIELALTLS